MLMQKMLRLLMPALCAAAILVGPARSADGSPPEAFAIHGSNTIGARLMPALVEAYATSIGANALTLVGSQPEEVELKLQTKAGATLATVGIQSHGSGTGVPGDERTSTSFFGVATIRATDGENPLWISAGVGNKRFRNGFINASAAVAKPVRLWAEYDGFDPNFGALFTLHSGGGDRPTEFTILVGMVKKYPTLAFGLGF